MKCPSAPLGPPTVEVVCKCLQAACLALRRPVTLQEVASTMAASGRTPAPEYPPDKTANRAEQAGGGDAPT